MFLFNIQPNAPRPTDYLAASMFVSNVRREERREERVVEDRETEDREPTDSESTTRRQPPTTTQNTQLARIAGNLSAQLNQGFQPLIQLTLQALRVLQSSSDVEVPQRLQQAIATNTLDTRAASIGQVAQLLIGQIRSESDRRYANAAIAILDIAKKKNGRVSTNDILQLCSNNPSVRDILMSEEGLNAVMGRIQSAIDSQMSVCRELISNPNKRSQEMAKDFMRQLESISIPAERATHIFRLAQRSKQITGNGNNFDTLA